MEMNIREKLLKPQFKDITDAKEAPINALLDVSENESKILNEIGIKTIADLALNWKDYNEQLVKRFPRERINSFVAASRLLIAESTERITTGAKIILAGVDNAGKTSLSIALKHRGALSLLFQKLYALTPTRGLLRSKIEVFGMDIHLHELGGQKTYRDDYIQNPQQYFVGTDTIVYVVDVQARDRYEESFEYLKQIINVTKSLQLNIPWKLFFHKSDPETQIDTKTAEIFNAMINYMGNNISVFSPSRDIFRTSVKIRSSVLGAFSHIFRQVVLVKDWINDASRQVAEKLNADYFGLYDFRSNVCFAQYVTNEEYEELAHNAYYEAIETIANMREPFLRIRRFTLAEDKNQIFILRDVKFSTERYIMAMLTPDEKVARSLDQDEVEAIIENHLQDWIEFRRYARFPTD